MKYQLITIPIALILSGSVSSNLAFAYSLADTVIGTDFYKFFEWQDIPDPLSGRVNYVDQETSKKAGLTRASADSFILRADNTTVLKTLGPGRDSVRIKSVKTYTKHVVVFDLRHMPQGCGTWPTILQMDEASWPNGGELDILQGVNDQSLNAATFFSESECIMPDGRRQLGTSAGLDCNYATAGGCSVLFPSKNSYGPAFNNVGGGWYAVERTSSFYKVWFWPRNAADVPSDVKKGASTATPDNWGTPVAYFPNTKCDFSTVVAHNIFISLTLCGNKADDGKSYSAAGCPSTCVDFVDKNPSAFTNAYFDFASIRVYQ